ncbi:MAG: DUF465 domain-containing protein [Alphaproteobacteria bacterium]
MVAHLEDLELLKQQHAEWDKLLRKEEERPFPDRQLIQSYKKHKLKIKEEIQKTENELFKEP